MTEAHQTGADVRSLTEALIAHAQGAGGQITSAEVVQTVESAEVTPAQAKKILRALVDAGITVVVDGSASTTRRRVAAARAATPASKATTAKAT
ncbi:RNA polymerase sigma factor region1.1 domain-containing protein, partial [Actinoplanes sp. TFC3]|uniref:RNA polymerase sigma factor region1.1 domain-containing protein n=1 Tax=Actinoplanes sp. TFC3 TaxID=1710355 RepID=UPI0026F47DF7